MITVQCNYLSYKHTATTAPGPPLLYLRRTCMPRRQRLSISMTPMAKLLIALVGCLLPCFFAPCVRPLSRNDVQCMPICIQIRSAVPCAKAMQQTWEADHSSTPDVISILIMNGENATLETGRSKPSPHRPFAPARGWAFAFAFAFPPFPARG